MVEAAAEALAVTAGEEAKDAAVEDRARVAAEAAAWDKDRGDVPAAQMPAHRVSVFVRIAEPLCRINGGIHAISRNVPIAALP